MNAVSIEKELKQNSNKEKAIILQRFFKTKKGEYGQNDIFLGITTPKIRGIAKKYFGISLIEVQKLLQNKIHECRQIALFILIKKFENAKKQNVKEQEKIFNFYLKNSENINNWDLVDVSAPKIVGEYLIKNKSERKILFDLANTKKSKNSFDWLWKKRISIVSTLTLIKNNEFEETIIISESFLKEKHDLLHKATGWVLREVGKKDEKILKKFLEKNCKKMPRTMLRYAIEKLNEKERKYYLGLK